MKISVVIPTRGRPQSAAAVITVARSMASGNIPLEFILAVDENDKKTRRFFVHNDYSATLSIGPRPLGLGQVLNRGVKEATGDFITILGDDVFISTPDWDEGIVRTMYSAFSDLRVAVLGWYDMANPGQATFPIFSKEWAELLAWAPFDGRFPFWFDDTCHSELWSFIVGNMVPVSPALSLAAKPGKTQGFRDIEFWWEFYVATREERLAQAAKIREELQIDTAPWQVADMLRLWELRDFESRREFVNYGVLNTEPDARYRLAKLAAESYLAAREKAA